MEKVSIIIPVYNTEEVLLENCVLSVLNQDNCKVEVILIDDGSNRKETITSCIKYQEKYDNVQLIRQVNQGPSAARYTGICAAAGKYIMFLDSDDCLIPNAVSCLTDIMDRNKCDVAEGAVKEVMINVPGQENCVKANLCIYSERTNLLQLAIDGCQAPLTWSLWGKMFKTDIMKKSYHAFLDINRGEDLLSLVEYLVNSQNFIYTNRCVYYYNKGNVLSITKNSDEINLSLCLVWEKITNICRLYGYNETYLKAKANYCGSVFGTLLQCIERGNEEEREKFTYLREIMYQNKWQYIFNKYISRRGKCVLALICPQIFKAIRVLKARVKRR